MFITCVRRCRNSCATDIFGYPTLVGRSLQIINMRSIVLLCLVVIISPKLVFSRSCGGASDILFMIDDSGSTRRNNPSNPGTVIYAPGVKSFIQQFIDNSNLGDIRLSVLAFSDTCRVISGFGTNSSALTSGLSTFAPVYKRRNLLKCFEQARTIFQSQGRLGVPKYVIVLTHGRSRTPALAADQATILETSGVDVIAIAFGDAIPISELSSYAKESTQVFKVHSDTELSTLYTSVSTIACPESCAASMLAGNPDLFPFPGNCAKFLQVVPAVGCMTRDCAYTTMWNDDLKVCDYPSNSTCDPCRGQPDGQETFYHFYCNSFWECQGGVSQARCCGLGAKYVQGSGCVLAAEGECIKACS